ncbi:MAG TPA: hypothetical protein DIW81_02040 [Planctomycetaceae bacterium]|nr:hypothetical protein [Rubinisphaera sp.]HCS50365.1 hypothetical protein [Planctomycetaceae bacterium]|tara:strand:+ start:18134 stop:18376 length:243 start_codon:yes stop_codon:yes gene_type:complete
MSQNGVTELIENVENEAGFMRIKGFQVIFTDPDDFAKCRSRKNIRKSGNLTTCLPEYLRTFQKEITNQECISIRSMTIPD